MGVALGSGSGQTLRDRGFDLAGLGEASGGLLREQELAVEGDLEHAARSLDQLGVEVEALGDFRRQTGGAGVVVSNDAVLDRKRGHVVLLGGGEGGLRVTGAASLSPCAGAPEVGAAPAVRAGGVPC